MNCFVPSLAPGRQTCGKPISLSPFLQSPVATQGFRFVDPADTEAVNAQQARATDHAMRLIDAIGNA